MKVGTSYKQHPVTGNYDAIVIGSGMGGLGVAAMLAKHGRKKVLVLERHYTAGGFTHAFTRPGYEWDVGVHYIGEVHRPRSVMRAVFDYVTNGALQWENMGEVYDRILVDGQAYDLVAGREAWRARMHGYFPSETAAIDRYLELVETCVRKTQSFFMEKALPAPLAALGGPLLRAGMMQYARRTTLEVLQELTQDKRLIAVLCGQYGDYGLPPAQSSFMMHATVVKHYLAGGAYPVGGAGRIAQTVLPVIEAAGGAVRTSATVQSILMERGRAVGVVMEDGVTLRAPAIISAAGVAVTYGSLVPQAAREQHGLKPALEGAGPSLAHMSLYLGFRETAQQLGLPRHNLWIYPSDDHDAAVAAFMQNADAPFPVVYVSFPSAKDPDFERRYPGRATVEVVVPAPYNLFAAWEDSRWHKRGADYDALKERFTQRILEVLFAHCPQLRGKVDHAELSTPLSTRHFAGHPHGEIYGLDHTPARFEARWLKPATPIPGLFLTGADICTAGVGGALMGGALTASVLLRTNMVGAIMAAHTPQAATSQGVPASPA